MKTPKTMISRFILSLCVITLLAACGGGSENPASQTDIVSIEFSRDLSSLTTQTESQLNITAKLSDGSDEDITAQVEWNTSNPRVANIDENGTLQTFEFIDDVVITATFESLQAVLSIAVSPAEDETLTTLTFPTETNIDAFTVNSSIIVTAAFSGGSVQNDAEFKVTSVTMSASSTVLQIQSASMTTAAMATIIPADDGTVQAEISAIAPEVIPEPETAPEAETPSETITPEEPTPEPGITPPPISILNDHVKLTTGINPAITFTESDTEASPRLSTFNNPVGLLPGIDMPSVYTGLFFTLIQPSSNEKLILIIKNPAVGTFDKTQSNVLYQKSNGDRYMLDDSESTNINITLNTLGQLGEKTEGSFSGTLCKETIINISGNCSDLNHQLTFSGIFSMTTEADYAYQSTPDSARKSLNSLSFEKLQAMGIENSHYQLSTTIGQTYEISTNSLNAHVTFKLYSTDGSLIGTSEQPNDNTQSFRFIATSEITHIEFIYTGAEAGATFGVSHQLIPTEILGSEGSEDSPIIMNTNNMFSNKDAQVDHSSSYYLINVLAGYEYRLNITNVDNDPLSKNISQLSYKLEGADNYAICENPFLCIIKSDTASSIKLKIDGPNDEGDYAKFKLSTNYNPVRAPGNPEEAFTVSLTDMNNLKGQVPNGSAASLNNNNFGSGASVYWVEGLTANTYYKVSMSGLKDATRLWVNSPPGALASPFNCPSGVIGTAEAPNVYCIIKTGNYAPGISLYIDNSSTSTGTIGTTYTLDMEVIDSNEIFYFSTFKNDSTFSCQTGCQRHTYVMYLNDERLPFASSITTTNTYHKKLLHIKSGDSIYIRLDDRFSYGNAYSVAIANEYKNFSPNSAENPDKHEPNNTKENATRLTFDFRSDHTFSRNSDNFGDVDWLVFTAP